MTNHARNGAARERRVRDDMAAHGWVPIMRAAGSKGVADLALCHPFWGLALVQVGTAGKSIGPVDRTRFLRIAGMAGALAIVATQAQGGFSYRVLGPGPASTWDVWTPTGGTT